MNFELRIMEQFDGFPSPERTTPSRQGCKPLYGGRREKESPEGATPRKTWMIWFNGRMYCVTPDGGSWNATNLSHRG